MSDKNLFNDEAKKKIKEMAESIDFNMMATDLESIPLHTVPMSTKKVDYNATIWFLSGKDSKHNSNIQKDNRVHLFYAKAGAFEFLSIYGKASIINDRSIIEELYQKSDDNWFDGVNDPNICALRIEPSDAHYWDTKDNMLVSLLKMGYGALTGKKTNLGEEGQLKL